jgi:hypothetical protein
MLSIIPETLLLFKNNTSTCYNCRVFNKDVFLRFDIGKCVHHHTIQINQPTRRNIFTSLLLDVYVWLNLFWASPRPSSGAYNCSSSLWFYQWSMVVAALLIVVWPVNQPDHNQQCRYHHAPTVKPEAATAVVSS